MEIRLTVDTASDVVEAIAVSICSRSCDAAAGICVVLVAIGVQKSSSRLRTSCVNSAACCCMQSYLICTSEIDAFDDIDLAAIGPVGTKEPRTSGSALPEFRSS
jgi:hypothetical protein